VKRLLAHLLHLIADKYDFLGNPDLLDPDAFALPHGNPMPYCWRAV